MSKADLNKQPTAVAAMFDAVAPTYDRTNDLLSFGQDRLWRTKVRAAVAAEAGQSILDLAAGTGTSSVSFLKPGVRVVASDFSEGMLAEGRKRHPQLEFVFADATNLPFKDAEFDAFITFLNIDEQFIKTATEMELILFIKDKYDHFRRL